MVLPACHRAWLALYPGHLLVNNLGTRLQAGITRYSFPGLHHCPVFDHLQYTKQRGKSWDSSSCAVMWHNDSTCNHTEGGAQQRISRQTGGQECSKGSVTTAPCSAHSRLINVQFVKYYNSQALQPLCAYPLSTWQHCTWEISQAFRSEFAYWKRSKTGGGEGLGTWLATCLSVFVTRSLL